MGEVRPCKVGRSRESYDGLDAKAVAALKDTVLFEDILPPFKSEVILPGSTDVGDLSCTRPIKAVI